MALVQFDKIHNCIGSPGSLQTALIGDTQQWAISSLAPLINTGDCLQWKVIGDVPQMFVGLVLDPDIDLPFAGVWSTSDAVWSYGEVGPDRAYFAHPPVPGFTLYDEATAVFKILRTDTGLEYYVDGILVDTRAAGGVDLPGPPMPPLYPAFLGAFSMGSLFNGIEPVTNCEAASAEWPLAPLGWSAVGTVQGPPVFEATGRRFGAGNGSSWWVIPQLTDSGDELRTKNIKAAYIIGKTTNGAMRVYRYDVGQEVIVRNMELDERVKGATRSIAIADKEHVAQSRRQQVNVTEAVMSTIRISGNGTGETIRDRVDQITYEVDQQGVRR